MNCRSLGGCLRIVWSRRVGHFQRRTSPFADGVLNMTPAPIQRERQSAPKSLLELARTWVLDNDVGKPIWATGLPGHRRSASVRVSGSGSVSDQRKAACVGDSRERDGRARSARGGQGGLSVPKPQGRAARGTLSAFRVPHTNSLTLTPTRPATRGPALRAARNFPTDPTYLCAAASWSRCSCKSSRLWARPGRSGHARAAAR